MNRDIYSLILIRSNYSDVMRYRRVAKIFRSIIDAPYFWREKSFYDFACCYQVLTPDDSSRVQDNYVYGLSRRGQVVPRVEKYLSLTVCLEKAYQEDNFGLVTYFIQQGPLTSKVYFNAFMSNQLSFLVQGCSISLQGVDGLIVRIIAFYLGKRGQQASLEYLMDIQWTRRYDILTEAVWGARKARQDIRLITEWELLRAKCYSGKKRL